MAQPPGSSSTQHGVWLASAQLASELEVVRTKYKAVCGSGAARRPNLTRSP